MSINKNSISKVARVLVFLGMILAQFTAPSMAQARDLIVFNGKIATLDEKEEKWADFIVIDQDYFSVPERQIADIQVSLTVLGGQVVYANPDFGPVDHDLFRSPDYTKDAVLTN